MHLKILLYLVTRLVSCVDFLMTLEREESEKVLEGGRGFIYSRAMSG